MSKTTTEGGPSLASQPNVWVFLAAEPYDRFESGEKTVEVRQDGPRWRNVTTGRPAVLSRGYGKQRRMAGHIGRVARAMSYDKLPDWARLGVGSVPVVKGRFFDTERPLVAFEVLGLRRDRLDVAEVP